MLAADPERVHLGNVSSGESKVVMVNPTSLAYAVDVRYARHGVPGLSHEPLQYTGTGNRTTQPIDFALDRFFAADQADAPDIRDFENFLLALTVPPAGTSGAPDTRPPRCLIVWPGVITIETVLTRVEFSFSDFGLDGGVLAYTAKCTFEEILDRRRTSEEYRRGV